MTVLLERSRAGDITKVAIIPPMTAADQWDLYPVTWCFLGEPFHREFVRARSIEEADQLSRGRFDTPAPPPGLPWYWRPLAVAAGLVIGALVLVLAPPH